MAARNLGDLAVKMRSRAERIETLASDVAVAATKEMLDYFLVVTPVLTTEAVSNWQVTLGRPSAVPIGPYSAGNRTVSAGRARDEALEALAAKTPGVPIYLSNTAAHIVDLDRGSSAQFSGGFVSGGRIVFRLAAKAAVTRLLG